MPEPAGRSAAAPVALAVATAATAAVLWRGPKGSAGPNLLLLLAAFTALGVLVWAEFRRAHLDRRLVFAAVAGLTVMAVVVPPTESHDVNAYAWYGRVAAHYHASPYRHAPIAYPHDPVARRVDKIWKKDKSVYGPVFTVVSAAGMAVVGTSKLGARLLFQGLAALCMAAALVLLWRRTRSPAAVALLGVNPVTVISVVNGGHNDAWVGLAVLGGVLLVMRGRLGWAGAVLAAAALVKVAAVLPLLAVGLWVLRRQGFRPAARMGGVAAGACVVGYAAAGGVAAFQPLHTAQLHFSGASVWYGPRRWLTLADVRRGLRASLAGHMVRQQVSAWATAAVMALTLLLVARRLDHSEPALVAGAAVFAYALLGAYVLPWYLIWGLPALLLAWRSRLTWLAMLYGALLLLAYLPDPGLDGHVDKLYLLTPLQRLQLDIFQVWVPLLELAIIAVVLVMTLRRPRELWALARMSARAGSSA